MALLRGNSQLLDGSLSWEKLESDFLDGVDLDLTNSNNDATITGLKDGINPHDAVNYQQLMNLINGRSWKQSVRLFSDTNLNPSGSANIDGVAVADGDRVAIFEQTTITLDGVYVVDTGGPWSRTDDFATGAGVASFSFMVEEGDDYKDTQWTVTNDSGTDVIGTDDIILIQTGGSGSIVAGDGLKMTGNVVDAIAADLSLTMNADDMQVNIGTTNGDSLEVSATGLELRANVTGNRTFSAGSFTINSGANPINLNANSTDTGSISIGHHDYTSSIYLSSHNTINLLSDNLVEINSIADDVKIWAMSGDVRIEPNGGSISFQDAEVANASSSTNIPLAVTKTAGLAGDIINDFRNAFSEQAIINAIVKNHDDIINSTSTLNDSYEDGAGSIAFPIDHAVTMDSGSLDWRLTPSSGFQLATFSISEHTGTYGIYVHESASANAYSAVEIKTATQEGTGNGIHIIDHTIADNGGGVLIESTVASGTAGNIVLKTSGTGGTNGDIFINSGDAITMSNAGTFAVMSTGNALLASMTGKTSIVAGGVIDFGDVEIQASTLSTPIPLSVTKTAGLVGDIIDDFHTFFFGQEAIINAIVQNHNDITASANTLDEAYEGGAGTPAIPVLQTVTMDSGDLLWQLINPTTNADVNFRIVDPNGAEIFRTTSQVDGSGILESESFYAHVRSYVASPSYDLTLQTTGDGASAVGNEINIYTEGLNGATGGDVNVNAEDGGALNLSGDNYVSIGSDSGNIIAYGAKLQLLDPTHTNLFGMTVEGLRVENYATVSLPTVPSGAFGSVVFDTDDDRFKVWVTDVDGSGTDGWLKLSTEQDLASLSSTLNEAYEGGALAAGGAQTITVDSGAVVWDLISSTANNDIRFLLDGDTNPLLEIDADTGFVGLGTAGTPGAQFHVHTFTDSVYAGIGSTRSTNTATTGGLVGVGRLRGLTFGSPVAVLSGDTLGTYTWSGQLSTTPGEFDAGAGFTAITTENWDATHRGTKLNLMTTLTGTATRTNVFTVEGDGTLTVGDTANYENLVLADDDIPNKKYVDDTIASNGLTEGNGIQIDSGEIQLGNDGTPAQTAIANLTRNTVLDDSGNDVSFRIRTNTGGVYNKLYMNPGSSSYTLIGTEDSSSYYSAEAYFNVGTAILRAGDDNYVTSLTVFNDYTSTPADKYAMRISSSNPSFAGVEYDVDYSTNYSQRSLVDKAYVDAQIPLPTKWDQSTTLNVGLQTATLSTAPATGVTQLRVYLNGNRLVPTSEFTVTNAVTGEITFTASQVLSTGDVVIFDYVDA